MSAFALGEILGTLTIIALVAVPIILLWEKFHHADEEIVIEEPTHESTDHIKKETKLSENVSRFIVEDEKGEQKN